MHCSWLKKFKVVCAIASLHVDLVGGYYDAGDHVKFGLPMAFIVTMLSWSVIEYWQQIADAGELEHAMQAIKWGTDYFIKAHTSPNVLWAEVQQLHQFSGTLSMSKVRVFEQSVCVT